MIEIASLLIGDTTDAWERVGFLVQDGAVHVDGVAHQLGGERSGIRAWGLRNLTDEVHEIDGVPSALPAVVAQATPAHPNGVIALDHVVLATADLDRTIKAFEGIGLDVRRTREAPTYGSEMRQAFFRMGPVILEVIGPVDSKAGDGSTRFFGLAFTVEDLDATAAYLGDRLKPAKDAVQEGRRIATLSSAAGLSVPIAFMSR